MNKKIIWISLVVGLGLIGIFWLGGSEKDLVDNEVGRQEHGQEAVQLIIHYPESIETAQYDLALTNEATVAQVLEKARQEQGLELVIKDYGEEMGILVESMGGIAGDIENNFFWYLYVNDELSPTGASMTVVRPGDRVIWRYEESHEL